MHARRWRLPRATTAGRGILVSLAFLLAGCQATPSGVGSAPATSVPPLAAASPAASAALPSPSSLASPAASQAPIAAGNQPTLRVVYTEITSNRLPLWYGVDNGVFDQNGVHVEDTFVASTPNALAALMSGGADVLEASGGDLTSAISKGAQLTVIGTIEQTTNYELVVAPTIKSPQDLVGKSVGVSRLGGNSYVFVKEMMQALGIDGQVTISPTGDLGSTRAAFNSGAVTGYADTPDNLYGVDASTYTTLGDPGQLGVVATGHLLTVPTSYLQSHRDELTNFMKGYAASVQQAYTDQDQADQVYATHMQQSDPGFAAWVYKFAMRASPADGGLSLDPSPTVAMMSQQVKLEGLIDPSLDTNSIDPASTIDSSIMDQIKATPFWTQLWPNGVPSQA